MTDSMDEILSELKPIKKKQDGYFSKCSKIYPTIKTEVCIPKIIMQSWKTKEVPYKWRNAPKSIKKVMPDWKYVLMDDEDNRNMVKEHFPDFLPYYDNFPHNIQRVDSARYMFLYLYGGLYLDLDFIVEKDMSSLFSAGGEVFLVSSGNVAGYYTNSFMASKPRSKFWLEALEEMKKPDKWWYIGPHLTIIFKSGPGMISRISSKTKTVICTVPKVLVMPCSVCNLNCSTCEAYLKPLEGSSWTAFDTTFLNFWLCNWKTVVSFLILLLLIFLIDYLVRKSGLSNACIDPRKLFS